MIWLSSKKTWDGGLDVDGIHQKKELEIGQKILDYIHYPITLDAQRFCDKISVGNGS